MSTNEEVMWNHRVIKHTATYEEIVNGMPATWYSVQEVYYNPKDSTPEYHTSTLNVEGETLEELREELELMLKSLDIEPVNEIISEGCESCKDDDKDVQWYIDQYNRNRPAEEQVSTPEELENAIDALNDEEYIYERNPDTGETYRREFGDYDSPREVVSEPLYTNRSKGYTDEEVKEWKNWSRSHNKEA